MKVRVFINLRVICKQQCANSGINRPAVIGALPLATQSQPVTITRWNTCSHVIIHRRLVPRITGLQRPLWGYLPDRANVKLPSVFPLFRDVRNDLAASYAGNLACSAFTANNIQLLKATPSGIAGTGKKRE